MGAQLTDSQTYLQGLMERLTKNDFVMVPVPSRLPDVLMCRRNIRPGLHFAFYIRTGEASVSGLENLIVDAKKYAGSIRHGAEEVVLVPTLIVEGRLPIGLVYAAEQYINPFLSYFYTIPALVTPSDGAVHHLTTPRWQIFGRNLYAGWCELIDNILESKRH